MDLQLGGRKLDGETLTLSAEEREWRRRVWWLEECRCRSSGWKFGGVLRGVIENRLLHRTGWEPVPLGRAHKILFASKKLEKQRYRSRALPHPGPLPLGEGESL